MTGSWTIDSLEDGVAALCGDDRVVHLPAELMPREAREGAVLHLEREESGDRVTLHLRLDREATARGLDDSRREIDELTRRDPGGDLTL
jgi:hypothetical protein